MASQGLLSSAMNLTRSIQTSKDVKNGNQVDLNRGDALLIDFDKWMQDNWRKIVSAVNKDK